MMITTVSDLRAFINESILYEDAVNAESAAEVITKFPKAMKRFGIDPAKASTYKVLGTGTRGTALDIGNGKVFKVTNDEKEAQAAASLLGKDVKNIVHFYAVCKLGDTGFYGVLQEKLEPLPKEEAKAFNDALVTTAVPIWIKRAGGKWDEVKRLAKQYILDTIKKKFSKNLNSPEAQAFAKDANAKWNTLVTRYGLRDMFEILNSLGIDFHDYHAGNMMQRSDGTMVLIDLGMSNVRGSGKIETITEARGSIEDRWGGWVWKQPLTNFDNTIGVWAKDLDVPLCLECMAEVESMGTLLTRDDKETYICANCGKTL